jgi:LmbE family N-acetylglucosaminyl deacetylase
MQAGDVFAALEAAPVVPLGELVGPGGIVVVAPHPDDESLGCGGLIAAACREGRSVRLVVVSDGCGSHAGSRIYPPDRLRALREAETLEAARILGLAPEHTSFLGLPDAAVPKDGPDAEAAADAIAAAAREAGASAILVTWRHDPHCDHEASAAIVDLVRDRVPGVMILAYPVWGWTLPAETEIGAGGRMSRLDVSAERAVKRRAVMAHRSQTTDLIGDDPTGFRLAPEMIDRLCGPFERFIEERP